MTNIQVVKMLYEAFAARDREQILKILHPRIEWVQNEGFPGGGTHVGAENVLDNVFATFQREWQSWQAIVEHWLDAGEVIVALGNYKGTFKSTGRSMTAAFAHVYWVRDGQIVRFKQYTDTAKVAEAIRPLGYTAT